MSPKIPAILMSLQFMPHGYCLRWDPVVIWLNVISDGLTAIAYASIPILLYQVVRKWKKVPSTWIILAFGAFILACGATHIMAIVAIWKPLYLQEGLAKLITAIASVTTAICLKRLLPSLKNIPSHDELRSANEALAKSHRELEQRTAELTKSYAALKSIDELNKKSEMQFRQLADSMPQIVWTATPDGKVDYYNERWYNFTGFDRNLFGDPSWLPLLHPDDIQKRFKTWYAAVGSGRPFKDEYRFFDRATATYRWHLGRAVPIRDEAGTVIKWFGACTDIDDYKRAEADILTLNSQLETRVAQRTQELTLANEQLRRTQTWLRAMLHSATEVSIMALDNNGLITFFNSGTERLLGYKAEEVIGNCTPHKLYPPEQCVRIARRLTEELGRLVLVDEIFLAANQPAHSFISEAFYLHRNGSPIAVSLATSPMIDSNGNRLGLLAIAVDIRERKALELKLTENNLQLQLETRKAEEASLAKTNFLSSISHEIRNPMNAILGMADLLWESELSDGQRRYVEVFRRAGSNLLSLVNDILDISKIESGRFELESVEFDLQDLLDIAIEMIRPKASAKGLAVTTFVHPATPFSLIGDPVRLQQVLNNLLGNALKFTGKGAISLTVKPNIDDPTRLYFEVADTGMGIPPDKLESIFEDFSQAEASTTRRFGGTGLGLGICRRLVKRMGGDLRVRSQPGKGSAFFFEAAFDAKLPDENPPLPEGLPGSRVLIVDDDSDNRMIVAQSCQAWGMHIVESGSGAQLSSILQETNSKREQFDLAILDCFNCHLDCHQLISQIREQYPSLPVLVITANSNAVDETEKLSSAPTECGVKPIRRPELLRLVCNLLNPIKIPDQKPSGSPLKILVADDSDDNTFLIQEYLKDARCDLTFVGDGRLAVESASKTQFDLILLDLQMPVMDGLTAASLIRKTEQSKEHRSIPILALSGNATKHDLEASFSAGCNGHLAKPVSRQELLNAINQFRNRQIDPKEKVTTIC